MAKQTIFDARMKTPFTCLIGGSPMSGKTTFVKRLLELRWKLIDYNFDYLVWCFGQQNDFVECLRNQRLGIPTTVVHGLPIFFRRIHPTGETWFDRDR